MRNIERWWGPICDRCGVEYDEHYGGPCQEPDCNGFVSWEAMAIRTRDQLRGAVEDARMAGDLSLQAAFWRARAIELGASEDEFRKAHPLGGQSEQADLVQQVDAVAEHRDHAGGGGDSEQP